MAQWKMAQHSQQVAVSDSEAAITNKLHEYNGINGAYKRDVVATAGVYQCITGFRR